MASAKWPAMTRPKGAIDNPSNDLRHDNVDSNQGGSPIGGKERKNIAPAQRGGFGQQGRDVVYQKASMGGGRSGSGNPASRGGFSGVARGGNFTPDARVPSHGGSPQNRGGAGSGANYGDPGQKGVPGGNPTQAPAGAGNTSGRSYRLIAGRFKRAAMGAKASSGGGKYGAPPVTSNT